MPQSVPAQVAPFTGEQKSSAVVVFDFDGTLYSRDSFAAFLCWCIVRSPPRLLLALLLAPVAGILAVLPDGRRRYASLFTWVASVGLGARRFHARIEQFAALCREWLPSSRSPYGSFYQAALQRLQAHQARGETVLIATAAATPLVAALMREQGLAQVPVIGSSLRTWLGGMVCDFHAYGENKLLLLRRSGYNGHYAAAYTDSLADLPVLSCSRKALLVNMKQRHKTRMIRRCGMKPAAVIAAANTELPTLVLPVPVWPATFKTVVTFIEWS